MGDTVSWEVAPAENSLFVKPRERAGATNLIVVTDFQGTKRNYTFELSAVASSRSPGTFFKVRLRYPEYEAAQARLAAQRQQLAAALAAQNGAIKSALDIGVLPWRIVGAAPPSCIDGLKRKRQRVCEGAPPTLGRAQG